MVTGHTLTHTHAHTHTCVHTHTQENRIVCQLKAPDPCWGREWGEVRAVGSEQGCGQGREYQEAIVAESGT